MGDNCPNNCPHCLADSMEEAHELAEAKLRREEDDANFTDQDDYDFDGELDDTILGE